MGFVVEPDEIVGYAQDHQQGGRKVVGQAADAASRIWIDFAQIPIQP